MDDTTILIKTFERPESLSALLDSLELIGVDCPIMVADDGETKSSQVCAGRPNVLYLPMPFDRGLSGGRNFLVSQVETQFCILLDDDFIVRDPTCLPHLVSELDHHDYDIVAGSLMLEDGRIQHYEGWMIEQGGVLYMLRYTAHGRTVPMEIVLNFFAARAEVLRTVMWDDELKVCEHEDFFWRARTHGVRVGYSPRDCAIHLRDHGSARYRSFRNRIPEMRAKALQKNNWERTEWIIV